MLRLLLAAGGPPPPPCRPSGPHPDRVCRSQRPRGGDAAADEGGAPDTAAMAAPPCTPPHMPATWQRCSCCWRRRRRLPSARGFLGRLPLHQAAVQGHAAAAHALLAAAPAAAVVRDKQRPHPSRGGAACRGGPQDLRRPLPTDRRPRRRRGAHAGASGGARGPAAGGAAPAGLLADCMAGSAPLSDAEWALVPAQCRVLGAALPDVLQRSAAQAARLVEHTPPATSSACAPPRYAWRACRRVGSGADLPQPLAWRILSLCVTPRTTLCRVSIPLHCHSLLPAVPLGCTLLSPACSARHDDTWRNI